MSQLLEAREVVPRPVTSTFGSNARTPASGSKPLPDDRSLSELCEAALALAIAAR